MKLVRLIPLLMSLAGAPLLAVPPPPVSDGGHLAGAGESIEKADAVFQVERGPVVGVRRPCVILVQFPDRAFAAGRDLPFFRNLFFSPEPAALSMRRFYQENSYAKLDVDGQVIPQVFTADHELAFYGRDTSPGAEGHCNDLARELLKKAHASGHSFAGFDGNGDGTIDALIIVHAGPGEENTQNINDIWSHASTGIQENHDGVHIPGFLIVSEMSPVGTLAHEYGHYLGLPDLYDRTPSFRPDSHGVGVWCLMSHGNWAGPDAGNGSMDGTVPNHLSAWCKVKLGWIEPRVITGSEVSVAIRPSRPSPTVLKLSRQGGRSREYFLLEYRWKEKLDRPYLPRFDEYVRTRGMVIWHIDEGQTNNDNSRRYMVAIVQPDGRRDLEKARNHGDAGDVYPGWVDREQTQPLNVRAFNAASNPSSALHDGTDSLVRVTRIQDPGPESILVDVSTTGDSRPLRQAGIFDLLAAPEITLTSQGVIRDALR